MTIELVILIMCVVSLIWDAINTYLITQKNKTYEIQVEEIEDNLQPTAFEPIKDEEIVIKKQRDPFKFSMIGLNHGDKIVSTIDKNCSAQVYDENHIMFRGEIKSLSTAGLIIWHETHPDGSRKTALQGPNYWTYKGETLDHMRKRMENKE